MSSLCLTLLEAALSDSLWLDYAKTLFILAGICLAGFIAVKRLIPKLNSLVMPASEKIKMIAKFPLETRKTLYLIRAGKSVFLLAASSDTVQFMTALDPCDFEESVSKDQKNAATDSLFRQTTKTTPDRNQEKSLS